MQNELDTVSVAMDSLVGLREAMTLSIDGEFDEALERLRSGSPDLPAEVGEVATKLIRDYRALVSHHSFSIDEFIAAKRELQRKLDTIVEQQRAIQKLSAPIIDVWDSVVTVPLTDLDAAYAEDLAERLLTRVAVSKIAWVIVDLTAATQLDTNFAQHLMRLASAIRLMGAECLVTGIGPKVAQTLASLDVALVHLHTFASLKEGLKHCLASPSGRLGG